VSKIKAPPEKKRAEYDRDHRTAMEAPHAFRKNWPRKKARLTRVHRRTAEARVHAVLRGHDADELLIPPRPRGWLRKMGVGSLRKVVAYREKRRRASFLPRYVLIRYDATQHAGPFKRFLSELMSGRTQLAAQRAAHVKYLLDARLPSNSPHIAYQRWLRSFFSTTPQWEARVRTWITDVAGMRSGSRRRRTRS
jgi:hypothetical protein